MITYERERPVGCIEHYSEEPLFRYTGCCLDDLGCEIELYAEDLKGSQVGDQWACYDQDAMVNSQETWFVEVTVIYKDDRGVLLRVFIERSDEIDLVWIDLH